MYQRARTKIQNINSLQTMGNQLENWRWKQWKIYGVTKRKIITTINEHKYDIQKFTITQAKLNGENVQMDFKNVKKLAHYQNKS